MFKFFKLLFGEYPFITEPRYHIGDICLWPKSFNNGKADRTVQILNWSRAYDEISKSEQIFYDFIDIKSEIDYADVEEKELILLAFKEEIDEM